MLELEANVRYFSATPIHCQGVERSTTEYLTFAGHSHRCLEDKPNVRECQLTSVHLDVCHSPCSTLDCVARAFQRRLSSLIRLCMPEPAKHAYCKLCWNRTSWDMPRASVSVQTMVVAVKIFLHWQVKDVVGDRAQDMPANLMIASTDGSSVLQQFRTCWKLPCNRSFLSFDYGTAY